MSVSIEQLRKRRCPKISETELREHIVKLILAGYIAAECDNSTEPTRWALTPAGKAHLEASR